MRIHSTDQRPEDRSLDQLLATLDKADQELNSLPPLSDLESAKLEQDIAIDHLYYSSKIEGTTLTEPRIEEAIHGSGLSTTTEGQDRS